MIKTIKIQNINTACKFLDQKLRKRGIIIYQVQPINHERHRIIKTKDKETYYFLFKREPFNSWRQQFPQISRLKNVYCVDSINIPIFYDIIINKARATKIFIMYEDGTLLQKNTSEWEKIAQKHALYRRIQRLTTQKKSFSQGKDEFVTESTMSCYFLEEDVWK